MTALADISAAELLSLREIGRSVYHDAVPAAHGQKLVGLGFAFNLLGQLRITKAGRLRMSAGL
jgi:hypothetical protein